MNLSANDSRILTQVFDPESAADAPSVIVDLSLPPDPHIEGDIVAECRAREIEAIKMIESCGEPEKESAYKAALDILNCLIDEHSTYASAYNNRAQLHRWRFGDGRVLVSSRPDSTSSTARTAICSAFRDLDKCIALAAPSSPWMAISPAQGKLLAQAWTQRAAILWSVAKCLQTQDLTHLPTSSNAQSISNSADQLEWQSWDRTRIEEEASRCFYQAGVYGSEVGKAMAVAANPYARLCGSIVKEAMKREGLTE